MQEAPKRYQRHGLETRNTSVMIPRDLREVLDREAKRRNASASSIIVEALRLHLPKPGTEQPAPAEASR